MAMILDSFGSMLAEKLATLIEEEVSLLFGVKGELVKLQGKLQLIQIVLADAEKKAFDDKAISRWTGRLKDVMYDADDVIDEFRTKQLLLQRKSYGNAEINGGEQIQMSSQKTQHRMNIISTSTNTNLKCPVDVHKAHAGESDKFLTRSIC